MCPKVKSNVTSRNGVPTPVKPSLNTMDATSPPATCLFLSLPRELRDEIYTAYLDDLIPSTYHSYWTSLSPLPTNAETCTYKTTLPDLLLTCKQVYAELAPTVLDSFCMAAPTGTLPHVYYSDWEAKDSFERVCLGAFGSLRGGGLGRRRRLVLMVDGSHTRPSSLHWLRLWCAFLRILTSEEDRPGWFTSAARRRGFVGDGEDARVPAATGLVELVVDWCPDTRDAATRAEDDARRSTRARKAMVRLGELELLTCIIGLRGLEVLRLRGSYPAWWVERLRESSALRVVCEESRSTYLKDLAAWEADSPLSPCRCNRAG
ncbi:hypothetical protein B0T19DRAFT_230613 [Cercophora scortea]|uniref:Uncharacterized protein n=1 Tax=Cercophora scortea TaxID=314031 RepID=A0AAE0M9J7_9PEZI|nr:hypothetical protein B0T19DRAFT_230613 [Cercophora scortea]